MIIAVFNIYQNWLNVQIQILFVLLTFNFYVKTPQLKQLIEEKVYWELTVSGIWNPRPS